MITSMWSSLTLPAIVGFENSEDGEQSNEGQPGNGANQDQQGSNSGGEGGNDQDKSKQDDKDGGDPQKKIAAQDEIIARKQKALDDADTELQELRQFKKEQEDAQLSAEQKAEKELNELKSSKESLETGMQNLVLENAFLSANDIQWHSPSAALKLVDLSEVEVVEKNGTFAVKDTAKLKAALKQLADDNPYLVKSEKDDEEDKLWKGKSGDASKRQKQEKPEVERNSLRKKYPALRNR